MSFLDDLFAGYSGAPGNGNSGRDSYKFGQTLGNLDPFASGLRAGTGSSTDRAGQLLGLEGQQTGPFSVGNYNPNATTAAGPDLGQSDQTRAAQEALLQQLQGQSNGTAPSVAQEQLKDASNRSLQGSMALLASQRGGNPGMANYYAQQNQGAAMQQAGGQAVMDRLQEQLAARGLLGQVAGNVRGQDLNSAQLGMENNQFNAQQQNAMRNQQNQLIGQQETNRDQMNLASRNDAMNELYKFMGKIPGAGASMGSGLAGVGAVA